MLRRLSREYNDWLVEVAATSAKLPPWRASMYAANTANKRAHPDDYREHWDDEASLADAAHQMAQLEAGLAASGVAAGGIAATTKQALGQRKESSST